MAANPRISQKQPTDNQSFDTAAPCWQEHNTLRQIDVQFTDVCHETAYGTTVRLSFAVRVF